MGQSSSKGIYNIPSKIFCFPYFAQEDELLSSCKDASNSLLNVKEILAVASGMVLVPTQLTKATLVMTATTYLVHYFSQRLCNPTNENQSGQNLPSTCSDTMSNSQSASEPFKLRTLEDALIDVKINKAHACTAVSQIHAKFIAISNRYTRLLSEIPLEDRRLEVVPALQYCEEILQLFRDESHVFRKNPLVSAPFLVSFAGIYISLAEFSLVVIESYKTPLSKNMMLLRETLEDYKNACIKARESAIKIKPSVPDNMIEGAMMASSTEPVFFIEDTTLSNSPLLKRTLEMYSQGEPESYKSFQSKKEAIEAYKMALQDKYNSFFEQILVSVTSFSGFDSKDDGPTGQLDNDDKDGDLK